MFREQQVGLSESETLRWCGPWTCITNIKTCLAHTVNILLIIMLLTGAGEDLFTVHLEFKWGQECSIHPREQWCPYKDESYEEGKHGASQLGKPIYFLRNINRILYLSQLLARGGGGGRQAYSWFVVVGRDVPRGKWKLTQLIYRILT